VKDKLNFGHICQLQQYHYIVLGIISHVPSLQADVIEEFCVFLTSHILLLARAVCSLGWDSLPSFWGDLISYIQVQIFDILSLWSFTHLTKWNLRQKAQICVLLMFSLKSDTNEWTQKRDKRTPFRRGQLCKVRLKHRSWKKNPTNETRSKYL